jgi:hypothetical protein
MNMVSALYCIAGVGIQEIFFDSNSGTYGSWNPIESIDYGCWKIEIETKGV